MRTWALLTGEYPPRLGGVADHTRLLARALAAAGDRVHVLAPEPLETEPEIARHPLPPGFGLRTFRALDAALESIPRPRTLLVQYVPHAFELKGMNVPFAVWLGRHAAEPLWVMFHEVAAPLREWRAPRHAALGLVSHGMAAIVARAARRIFVSTTAWGPLLERLGAAVPAEALPVPSNVPVEADPAEVERVRRAFEGRQLVGHFGTVGGPVEAILAATLPAVLRARDDRSVLVLGRSAPALRDALAAAHPDLAARIVGRGPLPGEAVAAHLAACDVALQPYPDGPTTRRGSLAAALALGVPVVTNVGPLMEPFWRETEAVALAPSPEALLAATEALLADPGRRARARDAARDLYRATFAIENSIRVLRAPEGSCASSS